MFLSSLGEMTPTTWVVVIGAGLLLGWLISRRNSSNKDEIIDLKAEDFSANMRKGQLIDIRPEEAWKNGRINGSRNFPKREILHNLFKLRTDQPVFLCAEKDSGQVRSVARKLLRKGYKPIYILLGGMKDWPYQLKK